MGNRNADARKRDDDVMALVDEAGPEGASTADMAAKLGKPKGHVYLSIFRLKNLSRVRRIGELRTARWVKTDAA